MKQKLLSVFLLCAFLVGVAYGQSKIVTGRVSDERGTPLAGVTVLAQGKSSAVQTDNYGRFSIDAEKGKTISFRIIGFSEKTVTIGDGPVYNVKLDPSDIGLEEVIVTAYGKQNKEAITGSVVGVSAKDIEKRPVTSAVAALEVIAAQSTIWSSFFSHIDASGEQYAASSRKCIYNWLYNQIPATDARKAWWNGATATSTRPEGRPYNQLKFRYADKTTSVGDYIFLRAEEMHLVKAEALVQQEKYADAKKAIGELMKLRNPTGYQAILDAATLSKNLTMGSIGTPTTLMDQIILQRRIELWGESERIYDILRLKTGFDRKAAGTNHTFIPVFWNSLEPANKEFILTIPQKEFDGNTALDATKDQNPL